MMNCHGCEKETLNPHEDINKNESIEGGWEAVVSPRPIPLMGMRSHAICFFWGGYNGR